MVLQYTLNEDKTRTLDVGLGINAYRFGAQLSKQHGILGRMPFDMGTSVNLVNQGVTTPPNGNWLFHFDTLDINGQFIDECNHTGNQGLPVLSTVSPKFGAGSAIVSLQTPVYFVMERGDILKDTWTMEAWLKPTATSNVQWIVYQSSNLAPVLINASNGHALIQGAAGTTIADLSFGTYTAGAWVHYALVRNGTTIKAFKGGVQQSTVTISGTDLLYSNTTGNQVMLLGSSYDGYIDECRILNGTAAYTANFTPPTAPFATPQ